MILKYWTSDEGGWRLEDHIESVRVVDVIRKDAEDEEGMQQHFCTAATEKPARVNCVEGSIDSFKAGEHAKKISAQFDDVRNGKFYVHVFRITTPVFLMSDDGKTIERF